MEKVDIFYGLPTEENERGIKEIYRITAFYFTEKMLSSSRFFVHIKDDKFFYFDESGKLSQRIYAIFMESNRLYKASTKEQVDNFENLMLKLDKNKNLENLEAVIKYYEKTLVGNRRFEKPGDNFEKVFIDTVTVDADTQKVIEFDEELDGKLKEATNFFRKCYNKDGMLTSENRDILVGIILSQSPRIDEEENFYDFLFLHIDGYQFITQRFFFRIKHGIFYYYDDNGKPISKDRALFNVGRLRGLLEGYDIKNKSDKIKQFEKIMLSTRTEIFRRVHERIEEFYIKAVREDYVLTNYSIIPHINLFTFDDAFRDTSIQKITGRNDYTLQVLENAKKYFQHYKSSGNFTQEKLRILVDNMYDQEGYITYPQDGFESLFDEKKAPRAETIRDAATPGKIGTGASVETISDAARPGKFETGAQTARVESESTCSLS